MRRLWCSLAKPHKKTVEESGDEDEQMFMRIVRTIDDEQLYAT